MNYKTSILKLKSIYVRNNFTKFLYLLSELQRYDEGQFKRRY